MRRYYIKTYGCQMNVADSAKLAAVLEAAGYIEFKTDDSEIKKLQSCDLILVNTCVVRQAAEDRAAWYLTSLKGLKELNPDLKIGLCGCLVSEPGRDVRQQFPHVDFFVPPNSPESLKQQLNAERGIANVELIRTPHSAFPTTFVTIAHGCDNYCSYCVVPYVRGRETSRPMDEVLAEVRGLLGQGVTDITLLGQNVNSYEPGFANLLMKIQQFVIPNSSFVIRFMTSHPKDMSDAIVEAVAELPYVAKDFHLPLQSGDNEVLKKMNRGYTIEYFKGRVEKIRSLMPQARISTDLMVGFPGESDSQFENSLRVIRDIKFTMANMFAYSPRPQTAAASMPDQVPAGVKQERLQRLIELNKQILGNRAANNI